MAKMANTWGIRVRAGLRGRLAAFGESPLPALPGLHSPDPGPLLRAPQCLFADSRHPSFLHDLGGRDQAIGQDLTQELHSLIERATLILRGVSLLRIHREGQERGGGVL